MIPDIVVYFSKFQVCFHLFFLRNAFFPFEDSHLQHGVISLAPQWRHTQSTWPWCQVSWWSNCQLVFKSPHQLKLFLMMSPCSRAGVQKIGFPLTFRAPKCTISYLLAKCPWDKNMRLRGLFEQFHECTLRFLIYDDFSNSIQRPFWGWSSFSIFIVENFKHKKVKHTRKYYENPYTTARILWTTCCCVCCITFIHSSLYMDGVFKHQ